MKKLIFAVFLILGVSGFLFAGYTLDAPVLVVKYSDGSGFGVGAMSSARYSENDVEWISCSVIDARLLCYAQDASGTGINGFSYNPEFIDTLKIMNDSSYIMFVVDSNGEITRFGIENTSALLP